ncbi:cache domain-containing sensor histidine kinase [Paenibacillus ehimensis]|uniref:cache domain-containing sensor histidine kinase n=1 Tax=Paenibacillus ehimensis TaxID=79264 RepID=UPI00046E9F33|nr:sensor histidine kinase [Paenibacillus ehimensis]
MKWVTLKTNNIQIRKKLILSYLLVVFIPVLTVGLLLTESLKRMAVEHAVQQSINNVEKIKKRVEETLKVPTDISNKIYFDRRLKELLSRTYESNLEVYQAYSGFTDFNDYMQLFKEIKGIRFYTFNTTLLENWFIFQLDNRMEQQLWYKEALRNRGKTGWYYIPDETKRGEPYVSLVRPIYYSNMTYCGMLVITVNPASLQSIISQEPFETLIISEQDEVLVSKDQSFNGSLLEQLQLTDLPDSEEIKVADTVYQGNPVKVIIQSIRPENSTNHLRVVSMIPLESILKESKSISYLAYSIILCSLLVTILFILIFSRALTKRIALLIRDIRMVARGDLKHNSMVQGSDEIGQLSRHFNMMVGSIDELMKRVDEAQRQKHALEIKQRDIQFKMLVNQVNPHFLFNALETIRMKAVVQEEGEIADSIKLLGKLLRHNLEIGDGPVPLASEIDLVRTYLEIQRLRFGDKLTYELPEPSQAEGVLMLPMLIQPIVENAIVHGLENKMGKGSVSIKLERGSQHFRIVVLDDGIGMDPQRCEALQEELQNTEEAPGQRIGLRNVHQRIRLHYGSNYGVSISSIPGLGTKVIIELPCGGKEDV